VTGFADQSNIQQTPTPTVIPTPTPGGCGEGTIFDVTTQAALFLPTLPLGTVLFLKTSGNNANIVAIPPTGFRVVVSIGVSQPLANGQCSAGSFLAAVTSGVLPSRLSGTTVCVALLS
jgi:hypothetical protein